MNEKTKLILENNPFLLLLAELTQGNKVTELTSEMEQLTAAVMATGKKGKLTLELSLSPMGKGRIEIDADVKTKTPKLTDFSTVFFATAENQLQRTDPNQMELEEVTNFPSPAGMAVAGKK